MHDLNAAISNHRRVLSHECQALRHLAAHFMATGNSYVAEQLRTTVGYIEDSSAELDRARHDELVGTLQRNDEALKETLLAAFGKPA